MFFEHQINILEWFFKGHVTEDWRADENADFHNRNNWLVFVSIKYFFQNLNN